MKAFKNKCRKTRVLEQPADLFSSHATIAYLHRIDDPDSCLMSLYERKHRLFPAEFHILPCSANLTGGQTLNPHAQTSLNVAQAPAMLPAMLPENTLGGCTALKPRTHTILVSSMLQCPNFLKSIRFSQRYLVMEK